MRNRAQMAMDADLKVVDGSHNIAGGLNTTRAAINPPNFATTPAYRTGLRAIGFLNLNGSGSLVIEEPNDLGIARLTNLLGLRSTNTFSSVVEWLADIAFRVGKRIGDLARGLVADVVQLMTVPGQRLSLGLLQTSPSFRQLGHLRLLSRDFGQTFIAQSHNRLGGSPTEKNSFIPIGDCNERVHAQVYSNDTIRISCFVRDFTSNQHAPHAELDLHQPTGKLDAFRHLDRKGAAVAVGKHEIPVSDPSSLISVDHITVLGLAKWITSFRLAVAPKLARRHGSLAELADDLLNGLRVRTRILAFGPLLPTFFGGPTPVCTADAIVAFHKITPQSSSFLAGLCEHLPLLLASGCPGNLYRAITHEN